MIWRLITEDGVSASLGLATDEALSRLVGQTTSPPTLRLYTYRSHCALVGRFQTVHNEINLNFCQKHRIAVNRRPTGGGAILMGSDQLGVALTLEGYESDHYGRTNELMTQFSAGLVRGLRSLGVEAQFRRKNDLEVEGRKIAGLGIYRDASGGLLFHASLLIDLDVSLMLQVLKIPLEKISDKAIRSIDSRISTIGRETGRQWAAEEVRQKVAEGYAAEFCVELNAGDLTAGEHEAISALEREKYLTEEWIFQTGSVPDTRGEARVKTPGGLLEARVVLAGRILKAVYLGGDFFASEGAIADLEAHLRWHSSDPEALARTLKQIYSKRSLELGTISLKALTQVVQSGVKKALRSEPMKPSDPYGCFVPTGMTHG